jgi:hypothetical protein
MYGGGKRFGAVRVSNGTARELCLEFALAPCGASELQWESAGRVPPGEEGLPHRYLFLPLDARVRLTREDAKVVAEAFVGNGCLLTAASDAE